MAQYPILYKKDRKGRVRTWTAYVSPMPDGSAVLGTSSGLLGGKMTVQEITSPKGRTSAVLMRLLQSSRLIRRQQLSFSSSSTVIAWLKP